MTTMQRRHSKTPLASHILTKMGRESAGRCGSQSKPSLFNIKERLSGPGHGLRNLKKQAEDILKEEKVGQSGNTVTPQDVLKRPETALQRSHKMLTLRQ